MLSEKAKVKINELKGKYPDPRSALLPALEIAQREHGWLSEEAMREVGAAMDLPPTEVASVASFYTMFYTQPVGEHVIQVCTNISCSLLGAEHIVEYLSRKLGIGVGATTPDGKFTLLAVECLGSCGAAPMMQADETYYENRTEEKIDRILVELGKGDRESRIGRTQVRILQCQAKMLVPISLLFNLRVLGGDS